MELWIRSQNKEALANVKNVSFCKMKKYELKETSYTIKEFSESADAYCIECNGEFFGEYATRERCLEIIDEIQYLLKNNGSKEDRISQIISGIENEFVVCEMPEN